MEELGVCISNKLLGGAKAACLGTTPERQGQAPADTSGDAVNMLNTLQCLSRAFRLFSMM